MKRLMAMLLAVVLVLTLGVVPAALVGASPESGTVGLWHFDGDANDSSGYSNNGTVYGATYVSGKFDQALSFDGNDDYVSVPDSSSLNFGTGDFTIEAWVKLSTTSHPNIYYGVFDKGQVSPASEGRYSLFITPANKLRLHIGDPSYGLFWQDSTLAIGDTQWHYVAVSVDRDGNAIFALDSAQESVDVSASSSYDTSSTTNATIGVRVDSAKWWFDGMIDEVRIWDEAVSPGLVGLWHLDEGSGTTASDSSRYGNDGTISGASWASGNFSQALSFDGPDSYVDCGAAVDNSIATGVTLEAWIKPAVKQNGGIISNDYTWGNEKGYDFFLWAAHDTYGRLYIDFGNGTDRGRIFWSIPDDDWYGQWHHVAATWDGSTVRLYVDGSEVGTASLSGNYSDPGKATLIGGINYGVTLPYCPFNGLIDEVRIWNIALGSTAILQSYELGGPQTSTSVVQLSHQVLTGGEVVCFTSAFHLGRQDPEMTKTVDIYIMSSSGDREIDDVDLRQVTPKNTNGYLNSASGTGTHWTAEVNNGEATTKGKTSTSIHLYAELDTSERLGVNAQYLP